MRNGKEMWPNEEHTMALHVAKEGEKWRWIGSIKIDQ